MADPHIHGIGIVIPVYQGEQTLPPLLREIAPLTNEQVTEAGFSMIVREVVLVHDGAVDASRDVMLALEKEYPFVQNVWLSRNFGQHPATLAGMASSGAEWVVTMDEDGQQDPADIPKFLDTAIRQGAQLVYAHPTNKPPHGLWRNLLSSTAKFLSVHVLGHRELGKFNSFRLIDGEIARSIAAYCGSNVFLDVALLWVTGATARCPIRLRKERGRRSGYSFRSLFRHFWHLMLTSGTRPLRFITFMGLFSILLALCIMAYAVYVKFFLQIPVQGWASILIVVSFFSGCILSALGIIAEYLAVSLAIIMGRPLYLIVSKPPKRTR